MKPWLAAAALFLLSTSVRLCAEVETSLLIKAQVPPIDFNSLNDPKAKTPTTIPDNSKPYAVVLNRPPKHLYELLDLIAQVPAGETMVRALFGQLTSGEIRLAALTDAIKKTSGMGNRIRAFYSYEGGAKIIYLEPKMELGLLAVNLYHEITHSQDPKQDGYLGRIRDLENKRAELMRKLVEKLTKNGRPPPVVDVRQFDEPARRENARIDQEIHRVAVDRVFFSERAAHDLTLEWNLAMMARFPEAKPYFREQANRREVELRRLTDSELRRDYGLPGN